MATCTYHETEICSLCCALEKDREDECKKPIALGRKPGTAPA
ncbi:hypothetical protein [Rubrobacter marinus]|nr:hypothetical protein [Rubrobacter marinus]